MQMMVVSGGYQALSRWNEAEFLPWGSVFLILLGQGNGPWALPSFSIIHLWVVLAAVFIVSYSPCSMTKTCQTGTAITFILHRTHLELSQGQMGSK